jgi:enamine deaminase RidA (YjgF/YER057c/UK114 family)
MLRHSAISAATWLCILIAAEKAWAQNIRRIEADSPGWVRSAAVLVDDLPLIHTTQLLPVDDLGRVVGAGNFRIKISQSLASLRKSLSARGSNLSHVVQLNCYVARQDQVDLLLECVGRSFPVEQQPAVGIVVSPLPHP